MLEKINLNMSNFNSVVPFMNISKICRICLVEGEEMRSVFSNLEQTEVLEVNVSSLSDILTRITSVQITPEDGFPSLVCSNCIPLILGAYKFIVQFEHSYNVLQQYISDCIKQEVPQEVFDYVSNNKNEEDSYDFDNNVGDKYIESVTIAQKESLSKRKTELKIDKKGNETEVNSKIPNKRTRQKTQELLEIEEEEKPASSKSVNTCNKRTRRGRQKIDDEDAEPLTNEENSSAMLHPCPVCTQEFSALELREHAHTHKALKKYLRIPQEHKVTPTTKFYSKPKLKKTYVSIHNKSAKLHKCVMCNEEFTASNLRTHLETHRQQNQFKCDQCERVFKKLNHLNTHKVKHLKEYPYKCDQCGKGFVIKTNYDCHMLTHNTNEELPHECSHCLKRFSNPEHLNRHKLIHTENISYSVKYKVVKCNHCLERFSERTELKEHKCVPIEQAVNTRFPCKSCNKVFKNSSALYTHNRNFHKMETTKVLCSVCGLYVSNIYNHMMRHTGEKPFGCNQCGKRFLGKPQLRQHLLVHSGLKPFVCSICAKAFNNLYNLQVHERIHKGDKCHICPICQKGFLEKSYLKKHMHIHEKA